MASIQSNVDWQSTKNTILERNRHMFNNSDMSNIRFTCEGSDKTFYAHKYVLATSSDVFHKMLYGGLREGAVKDSIIHLPDTNEESLEQFLRFLYMEECTLTADNVANTMYLADKYMIPSLIYECVNFLMENLNPENVLDVLNVASTFNHKELQKQCWKMIEFNTRKVVASDSFNNINRATVAELLKRDFLKISEVELFQAVLKWIDLQCLNKNLEPTGQNRRSIIGGAIYDFRFFGMSHTEFSVHVCRSHLLTADEADFIWYMISKIDPHASRLSEISTLCEALGLETRFLKLLQPKRKDTNIVRVSRFPRTIKGLKDTWTCNGEPDRLCFSIDEEASLLGVRLFGKGKRKYQVTLKVKEATVTGKYTSQDNQDGIPGFDVMLEKPVTLKQNEVITLSVEIKGLGSCAGISGITSVSLEGASVTFLDAPPPNNGTDVDEGQFHELIIEI